ncbi:DCP2-domain-containing protein, partial [Ramicandelaber brevisporus]
MSFSNASFGQVLDDLCSRFIINVPLEELSSIERIYFQIEQALWFYDDFVREQRPGIFRKFQLNQFSLVIMNRCPLLHPYLATHDETYRQFINYKTQVPSCGAVIINKQLTKCVLVKGYQQGAGWGFPRGKINKDEPMEECAIRETFEETGFDVTRYLLPTEYLDRTMHGRPVRLYIAAGVDEKTAKFEIITRKEISDIQWFPLDQLP